MRVIADLEQQTDGEITVNGVSPREARLARAYGYVFQAPALYPWRSVLAQRDPAAGDHGLPRARARRRGRRRYLEMVGLDGLRAEVPLAALGRHAAAGLDRARAQLRARSSC